MPQDAFTLQFISRELDAALTGGKISRINQPNKDELTFFIYTKSGTVKLEICASAQNCRINLCGGEKDAPKNAQAFCMLLRKYLQNAQILCVKQIGFERIAAIEFDCTSDFERARRTLYCEIMGKYSNVVLVQDGKILGALKTASLENGARRILFPGAQYALPEPQDKTDPRDQNAVAETLKDMQPPTPRFIAERLTGISLTTAADICTAFGGNPTAKDIKEFTEDKFFEPCVETLGGMPTDFKVCSFAREKIAYPTLLQAQTAYYDYVCTKKQFEDTGRKLKSALSAALKKCEKRLGIILSRLEECKDAERVKLMGELITANIYAVERGAKSFTAINYYDENCAEITIPLDQSLTPAQNAQKYYKRYAKLKRTLAALDEQLKQTQQEKSYLESIKCFLDGADDIVDFEEAAEELKELGIIKSADEGRSKKKNQRKTSPYRRYEYQGYTIYAGRNNVQNERLTKSLSEKDMWLHAQRYHSCHAAIIYDGREFPDEVIKIAAEICAYYSEARLGGKVGIDYTLKKFVKKPSGAAAGFAVYTDYKTALVEPNRHGELLKDDNQNE